MKRIFISLLLFLSVTGLVSAANVFGQDIAVDVNPVLLTAQTVVVGLASIWAIKKVIALLNKS